MGLDNAYGIGSLKPGVCTSSTRPSSPFEGQVIFETDTNTLAVYADNNWTSLNPVDRDRNVIINGAMQIAQRGTSTASITTAGYYTADRWRFAASNMGTWTQSVENDAPTGSGFRKSWKVLATTADAAPAAADTLLMGQIFEGQNVQHFLKGTSSAKQFSLSFWVKSNVTGTYIVELRDDDNTRSVSASYTVSASATWEKKTVTFPADTTGSLDNDNAASLRCQWWLGAGTDFTSGTLATTWASVTSANRAVGQTNLASATNNYWQITGVQLEAGAVATPFEFEDYSTTLAKCQRYYVRYPLSGTAAFVNGFAYSSNGFVGALQPPVFMRATPTAISYSNVQVVDYQGVSMAVTSMAVDESNVGSLRIIAGGSSGLTTNRPLAVRGDSNAAAYVDITAEL